jgi:hypothetical protein
VVTGVVVLEYASEGRVLSSAAPYTHRYISVLTITDRKVTHRRADADSDELSVVECLVRESR